MNDKILEFLLNNEIWTSYRLKIDFLGENPDSIKMLSHRHQLLKHINISKLIDEIYNFENQIVNSHKKADLAYHKLSFLIELDILEDDNKKKISNIILKHKSEEGVFNVLMNIPEHFGGTGDDQWAWALCDAPLITYIMAKIKGANDKDVENSTQYLMNLASKDGFGCCVSKNLGKFRGPGKKDDICPYATLLMLKLLILYPEYYEREITKTAIKSILNLWENSKEKHPYMFYMGNDFRKIKFPFIWYDILHVAEVLSHYEYARKDNRFINIVDTIMTNKDKNGLFTAQSIWNSWKEFDFGQKKQPSSYITFVVYRILKRINMIA